MNAGAGPIAHGGRPGEGGSDRSRKAATSPSKKMKKRKAYWEMTPEELHEATKHFEEPFVADRSRPLTSAEQAQWNRVKRKRGRPKVGQGFKRISISMEQGLLKRASALAKKRRISRSKLFALLLAEALTQEKQSAV